MTEKELKKLNRKQLLELLLKQTERADELQRRLDEAEKRLRDRAIAVSEAGSFADAAIKLNGVFEAAEAAAAQYLENVKRSASAECAASDGAAPAPETASGAECAASKNEKSMAEREAAVDAKMRELSGILRVMYSEKKLLDKIFKDFNIE